MVDSSSTTAHGAVLPTPWRVAIGVGAVGNLLCAAAFATQQQWATSAWPWETGRLTYLFLASMLAAISTGAGWIAVSGETGSLPAGFLNLAVTLGGIAVYLLLGAAEVEPSVWVGVVVGALALGNLALFWWTRDVSVGSAEPLPRYARASYLLFVALLVLVGVALIFRVDGVMPWPVDPDTSVVIGWMFFGDAWYFAYALARPDWQRARAQLWSFLGYDLLLFVPLLLHVGEVSSEFLPNLLLYLLVLAYSGALAIWCLLLNPATRGWSTGRQGRSRAA